MATAPLEVMRFREKNVPSVISSSYGLVRKNKQGHKKPHQGWDLDAAIGTACYAIADGKITYVNRADSGDYGISIGMQFPVNATSTPADTKVAFYAHLSSIIVKKDEIVKEGTIIGYTGETGNAKQVKSPHLHFEIRTSLSAHPGKGLAGRIDPATVLGYEYYASYPGGTPTFGNPHPNQTYSSDIAK